MHAAGVFYFHCGEKDKEARWNCKVILLICCFSKSLESCQSAGAFGGSHPVFHRQSINAREMTEVSGNKGHIV
jgi:hypothetical protein